MRAITISALGGPDMLVPAEMPDPVPAEGEVLIDVVVAGVNWANLLRRAGLYPPPAGALHCPG